MQEEEKKSSFISQVSHDLRTPITTVRWYAEMLLAGKAGDLNEKQAEYVQFMHEAALSMETSITALRDEFSEK
jgi:signal transduction histidine kinase